MLILCNIFVELGHFIHFNNFDKYHSFICDPASQNQQKVAQHCFIMYG